MSTFPEGFLWGAATSAYQVEGAVEVGGRGESIWDVFCRLPGAIEDGSSGEPACDHYHRFREDVRRMRELGLRAYRFSIAWPRIFPQGRGRAQQQGLDFYRRLLDELEKAEILPVVTLYHWDLPQALQYRGGWASRDTAWRFADYAAFLFERLGDRVRHWITINEPSVVVWMGYLRGEHAPGLKDPQAAVFAAHHLLLAHGLAVQALRQAGLRGEQQIGIALHLSPVHPATDRAEDEQAARWVDDLAHRWFLEALFRASYPQEVLEALRAWVPELPIREGDLPLIGQPVDFVGLNYYTRQLVRHDPAAVPLPVAWVPPSGPVTASGWEIYPDGLLEALRRLAREFGAQSILVTENGAAFADELGAGEQVHDWARAEFLRDHLERVARAVQEGLPVRGYFVWSLLDGFEWQYGYTRRFGLFYVDFATQQRYWKQSARWYQRVVQENRLVDVR